MISNNVEIVVGCVYFCKIYCDGMIVWKCFEVLKGVIFEVKLGEVFGLLGLNGVGKIIFIKIFMGIICKIFGDVSLFGFFVGSCEGCKLIGYLLENLCIFWYFNVYIVLEYYGNFSNFFNVVIKEKWDVVFEMVGL